MGKISNTWKLMRSSWEVLKKDKELLVLSLLSGICCLVVLASFLLPIFLTDAWTTAIERPTTYDQLIQYGILFTFYFCNYFIIVFFNSAIVACAMIRMRGGDPTVKDGLHASVERLRFIAEWALVSATVGLILRILEDRFDKLGKLITGFLGLAWSVTSFLVIPLLVIEKKGPIPALKDSAVLLKNTWGENLVSNFGFGLIFFLLAIPVIPIIFLGYLSGYVWLLTICIVIGALYLILLALIQSTLQAIFQSALYNYARNGNVPVEFNSDLLSGAMRTK